MYLSVTCLCLCTLPGGFRQLAFYASFLAEPWESTRQPTRAVKIDLYLYGLHVNQVNQPIMMRGWLADSQLSRKVAAHFYVTKQVLRTL